MGLFFGIFSQIEQGVDLTAFSSMLDHAKSEFQFGISTKAYANLAIGYSSFSEGVQEDSNKPYATYENEDLCIVGAFRVDRRDQLADKLGIYAPEIDKVDDVALVACAYIKWGLEFVHHLSGDWIFFLWDKKLETGFLFKDRVGNTSLFYRIEGALLIFSSDVNVVASSYPDRLSLNKTSLLWLGFPGAKPYADTTMLTDVHLLPYGTFLSFDIALTSVKKKYWKPTSRVRLRYKYPEDYAYELRSFFALSVRSKLLKGRSAALLLSAGLDSSAVAFFASAEQNIMGVPLLTYTSFPYHIEGLSDKQLVKVNEKPYVERFVSDVSNIVPHFNNFEAFRLSKSMGARIFKSFYFPVFTNNHFWLEGFINEIGASGVKRLLTAQMGNFTISYQPPHHHLRMLLKGSVKRVFKDMMIIARRSNASIFIIFYRWIFLTAKEYVRSKWHNVFYLTKKKLLSDSIFDKEFISNHRSTINRNRIKNLPGYHFYSLGKDPRPDFIDRYLNFGSTIWSQYAQPWNIEIIDPTLDEALLDFCLSIPEDVFYADGIPKSIYKSSMQGYVPEYVYNKGHGHFQAADLSTRLLKDDMLNGELVHRFRQKRIPCLGIHFLKDLIQFTEKNEERQIAGNSLNNFLQNLSISLFLDNMAKEYSKPEKGGAEGNRPKNEWVKPQIVELKVSMSTSTCPTEKTTITPDYDAVYNGSSSNPCYS